MNAVNESSNGDNPARGRNGGRTVVICAGISFLLYPILPIVAGMVSSSRPSYAHDVFPWVAKVTDDMLSVVHANPALHANVWFIAMFAVLFALYGVMLRAARGCQSPRVQMAVFAVSAAAMLSFLFSPVMLSTDTFAYAFYGRILSVYHANAYADNPELTSDPFWALFGAQSMVSLYGPLWTLISAGVTRIAGNSIGLTVFLFRAFSALSTLGAGAFLWGSLKKYSPERATQGLVMFLANPLVIMESGLSGHNDATMVMFAMLAVWLHLRGWKTGAVLALTLSALVKFLTGMLVPLYILMILRGMKSWRDRGIFAATSVVAAGLLTGVVSHFANVKTDVPASSQATSPEFYMNNFHELAFHGMRRALGEDWESAMVPTNYGSWWALVKKPEVLRDEPSKQGRIVASLEPGQKLLVITETLTFWLRVYDPVSHKRGYAYNPVNHNDGEFPGEYITHTEEPGNFPNDTELAQLELKTIEWPTVVAANRWIRIVTWGLFAVFGLLAAWKAADFDKFLYWSGAALLASYYLVMTQIWPWYLLWALAFCAMQPQWKPARLAVLLSMFILALYPCIAYASGDQVWIYLFRSVPAIVLPTVLFVATLIPWRRKKAVAAA